MYNLNLYKHYVYYVVVKGYIFKVEINEIILKICNKKCIYKVVVLLKQRVKVLKITYQ